MAQQVATAPPRPGRARRRPWPAMGPDAKAAYIFLAPPIIGFTTFVAYPIVRSAYLALTTFTGLSSPTFIGLQNFTRMFTTDPSFPSSIRATFYLVSCTSRCR